MQSKKDGVFVQSLKNFLGPVGAFLEDERITEIMINGHDDIWVEVNGRIQKTNAKFKDEDALRAAVTNIAQSVGRRINDEEPRLDARLPAGYRIHAVIPPCARNGTTVAIRKFKETNMTLRDLISLGAISTDAAQFLDVAMKLGKNVIVSGGTGSGKTTLLGVLAERIPKGERLIVIEDSTELKVTYDHVVFFETRSANEVGEGEVNIRDLVKSSLRLRPDRIIVGEVRGGEAFELIQAMNTGHKGCMGTVHANSALDALVRIEALALGGEANISERAFKHQVASAVDLVVQAARFPDGSRRIAQIAQVLGVDEHGMYLTEDIYQMPRLVKTADGKLQGMIEPTGKLPVFMSEIEDNKIPFPRTKFSKGA